MAASFELFLSLYHIAALTAPQKME
jgi:hypothetical protein